MMSLVSRSKYDANIVIFSEINTISLHYLAKKY